MRTERNPLSVMSLLARTRTVRLVISVIVALLVGLLIGTIARAGFVDDWITQKSETSPGYFEGQKRGYFTGGSFSAHQYNEPRHYLPQ